MTDDLTVVATVPVGAAEVIAAVLDPRSWWSAGIEGPTGAVGDEFVYRYAGLHFSRIRVTRIDLESRVEWLAVQNQITLVSEQSEWDGTTMSFTARPVDTGTELTFVHHGLSPAVECFDICSQGWTHFIGTSLRALLVTGNGEPAPAATAYFP